MTRKQNLIGFRYPDGAECSMASKYVQHYLGRVLRQTEFAFYLSVTVGILLGVSVLLPNEHTTGENTVGLTLCALCIGAAYLANSRKIYNIRVLNQILRGHFMLLECHVHEVSFSNELVGEASVKIHDSYGNFCDEWLTLDTQVAKQCKENPDITVLLLRYEDFYMLLGN